MEPTLEDLWMAEIETETPKVPALLDDFVRRNGTILRLGWYRYPVGYRRPEPRSTTQLHYLANPNYEPRKVTIPRPHLPTKCVQRFVVVDESDVPRVVDYDLKHE